VTRRRRKKEDAPYLQNGKWPQVWERRGNSNKINKNVTALLAISKKQPPPRAYYAMPLREAIPKDKNPNRVTGSCSLMATMSWGVLGMDDKRPDFHFLRSSCSNCIQSFSVRGGCHAAIMHSLSSITSSPFAVSRVTSQNPRDHFIRYMYTRKRGDKRIGRSI